jgi:predicted SnoaL-like aldol condensation-catalyzing enzyme
MRGIRDGKATEAVTIYTGERYTQHSAGVKNGREGFIAFFELFVERNPIRDIEIICSFTDEQYVFLHVFQSLNNGKWKWVIMDMFDTDKNDKIIEHWDVFSAYEPTPSGVDMVGGSPEIKDRVETDDNKRLITNFLKHVFVEGFDDYIIKYVDKNCIQHGPRMPAGISDWQDYFRSGIRYEFVHQVIGEETLWFL